LMVRLYQAESSIWSQCGIENNPKFLENRFWDCEIAYSI